jgi:hypothetical protein
MQDNFLASSLNVGHIVKLTNEVDIFSTVNQVHKHSGLNSREITIEK